jgi:hypothetical protein
MLCYKIERKNEGKNIDYRNTRFTCHRLKVKWKGSCLSEVLPLCMNLYNALLCIYIYNIIYTKSRSTQQYKEQRLD